MITSTLCALWENLARLRVWTFRSGLRAQRRLRAPVVSIGNLTFGGTGKTPFTIWLAERLGERGYRAAILTRGYRRTSKGVRIYRPGVPGDSQQSGSEHDGDEVQLYLRHLPAAAVGIAAQRYEAGNLIESQTRVDVHLLDDGFQHLPLARNCDIVLIDSTDPWGARTLGERGVPRALREPPDALRRADGVILTRCEQASAATLRSLEDSLRRIHPGAALFRSETRLNGFRSTLDGPPAPAAALAGKRAVAFCGVGNPESFFALLRAAGLTLAATRVFPDHHRYNDQDVDQLNDLVRSHQAECLIATEKDVVNLPRPSLVRGVHGDAGAHAADHFAESFIVPAWWAEITPAIQHEAQLLALITQKIGPPAAGSGRH